MSIKIQERLAVFVTVVSLISVTVAVFLNAPWRSNDSMRVVHLTGVSKSGVWTDQKVFGLTYWWKSFQPATIVLEEGEEILLRLSSSDVTHTFYVPELYPEPVLVEPGHTVELILHAEQTGEYTYYCTTVCGECHYYMKGIVKVVSSLAEYAGSDDNENMSTAESRKSANLCTMHEPPAENQSFIEQGEYIFNAVGCITCHGEKGTGGIYNPNYIKEFIPRLDLLADRMGIYYEEDSKIIIDLLEKGTDLEQLEDDPPIDNYGRFIAQYSSILNKIHHGAPSLQKKNPDGPEPPLTMPSWDVQLSSNDIDAILAYLIKQYPWDEDDDD